MHYEHQTPCRLVVRTAIPNRTGTERNVADLRASVAITWHYVERPRLKQTARTTEGRDPRPGGQGQQEANASVVFTPYKGNDKPESQKQTNRAHAKLRSLDEHANAQLTSQILRKLRRPEQGRPPGKGQRGPASLSLGRTR